MAEGFLVTGGLSHRPRAGQFPERSDEKRVMFGIGWEEAAHVSGNPNEPSPRLLPARLWGCPLLGATHDQGGTGGHSHTIHGWAIGHG